MSLSFVNERLTVCVCTSVLYKESRVVERGEIFPHYIFDLQYVREMILNIVNHTELQLHRDWTYTRFKNSAF